MERITINAVGRARRAVMNGREWIVAPLTLIVPGVLNGSKGPLYYPPEEISKNHKQWDRTPIVVYHPTRNGRNVSARDPGVLDESGIGVILNPTIGAGGKLKAEGWFDIERTKQVDNRIYKSLQKGIPVELSTGLYTENEFAPLGSHHFGKAYQYVARGYRADHVAVLPDQIGACSIQDGCGVLVNTRNTLTCNCNSDGECSECKAKKKKKKRSPASLFTTNSNRGGQSMAALNESQREEIIEFLVSNCECWGNDGDDEVLGNLSDEKLIQLKEAADREQQAIAVANAAANGFADANGNEYRVNPTTGKWEHRSNPTANKGGKFPPKKKAPLPEMDEDEDEVEDDEIETNSSWRRPRTAEEWVRNAPPDVVNTYRYAQQIEQREKEALISQLLANVSESERALHRDRLYRRSVEELQYDLSMLPKQPIRNEETVRETAPQVSHRHNGDADMLGIPTMNWEEIPGDKGGNSTAQVSSSMTSDVDDDTWMMNAPAHIRQAVQNAKSIENRERRKLIDEIIGNSNLEPDAERRLISRLERRPLDELRDLVMVVPRQSGNPKNFFGQSAPLGNSRVNESLEDVLPLPTMNWSDNNPTNRRTG